MALKIEKLISSARGIGYDNGKTVILSNALPGEEVEYSIKRERKGIIEGEVTKILVSSPLRVEPLCSLYNICGGCDFQIVSPVSSALLKEEIVKDNLTRLGNQNPLPRFLPPMYGQVEGYRKRARIHVNPHTGEAGFLKRGSNELVCVKHCPLLDNKINALLEEEKGTLFKYARSLMFENKVNRDSGLVEVPLFAGDREVSNGDKKVEITLGENTYAVTADVFFQSNPALFTKILDYVKENTIGENIIDLYSGVGTFSALFNGTGKTVYAVEKEKRCLILSHINAPGAISYTDECEKWVIKGPKVDIDTVIVDPPRTGLDRKVIEMLEAWKPQRVIYVSCNPVTLSRDIAFFTSYKVEEISVYDCYYGSSHVETVCLMSRVEGK